ncbi:ImmA/IrrE family metallo-endopeptidase [Mycobacteroides abscessus]|nr:ImmA/IrrE family metallo-endopeptidase [Mycobacteroides abscessus]
MKGSGITTTRTKETDKNMAQNEKPTGGNKDQQQPGTALLTVLRRLAPQRRMAYWEHLQIAERQAYRLHHELGQSKPGVNLLWMLSMDNIDVVMEPSWRMEGIAGMTTWKDDHWHVAINKGDMHARRRFTLMHEFKHILDAQTESVTYQGITPVLRERIADHFSACYLMPKLWLRQAWTSGLRDPEALAGLFKVSLAAMRARLTSLQYLDNDKRSVASYFRESVSLINNGFEDNHRLSPEAA